MPPRPRYPAAAAGRAAAGVVFLAPLSAAAAPYPAPPGSDVDREVASRTVVIMAEGGMQPAMGSALVVGVDIAKNVAVDLGAGWSGQGLKSGARLRLHLAGGAVRPFVGGGLAWGFGRRFDDLAEDGTAARIRLDPGASWQAQVGVHLRHRRGISLLAGVGYGFVWGGSPPQVERGMVASSRMPALARLRGGGPVATLGVGYAF